MRKLSSVLFSVLVFSVAGAVSTLLPGAAHAQSSGVALSCGGSDLCDVFVSDTTSPQPFHYSWTFNTNGLNVGYPGNCTDQAQCAFYCPGKQGRIQANVTVSDANNQFIGSASAMAQCTSQPL